LELFRQFAADILDHENSVARERKNNYAVGQHCLAFRSSRG